MKKILAAFLLAVLTLSLAACGGAQTREDSSPLPQDAVPAEPSAPDDTPDGASDGASDEGAKTLVVYFSMPETDDPADMTAEEDNSAVVIDGEVLGNTQYMAYVIAENTGADLFRIEPETPYTTEHEALIAFAKEEQNTNARPALKANVENLDEYGTVFIGYPNWWGDMPMILYTFFDENDFSGKTIIPFNTHGGSGFSGTVGAIAELEPNADVSQNGLSVSRGRIQDAEREIIDWLDGLGLV